MTRDNPVHFHVAYITPSGLTAAELLEDMRNMSDEEFTSYMQYEDFDMFAEAIDLENPKDADALRRKLKMAKILLGK